MRDGGVETALDALSLEFVGIFLVRYVHKPAAEQGVFHGIFVVRVAFRVNRAWLRSDCCVFGVFQVGSSIPGRMR